MDIGPTSHPSGVDPDTTSPVLVFLRGCRSGWTGADLALWARRELIRPGFLRLNRPMSGNFLLTEDGITPVWFSTLGEMIDGDAPALLEDTYAAVGAALREFSEEPRNDRFVREALYGGRVIRGRLFDRGIRRWMPSVAEGTPLSKIVLAMLAADVLAHPEVYDRLPHSGETDHMLALLGETVAPVSGERLSAGRSGMHVLLLPARKCG